MDAVLAPQEAEADEAVGASDGREVAVDVEGLRVTVVAAVCCPPFVVAAPLAAGTNTGADATEARFRKPAPTPPAAVANTDDDDEVEEGAREWAGTEVEVEEAAEERAVGRTGGWGAVNRDAGASLLPPPPLCHTEAGPMENRGA